MNTQEFIEKAKKIHNNKYDYSKVEYVNVKTKVCIICPEHGEFWQTPDSHINGKSGCPKCGGTERLTIENFAKKACEVHSNKYDYSKVEYVNNQTKVCIVCPEHGEFWQTPMKHLVGRGCPKCGKESRREKRRKSIEDFIKEANEIHRNKYDYSKVEYKSANEKVCIICPEHGEFWITPSKHITSKRGCPKCSGYERYTTESWIQKACDVHSNKYDYSKVEYKSANEKVCIICPEHGEFWQTPSAHVNHLQGCPKCIGKIFHTTESWIQKACDVHSNKYDYSKVEFINANEKVCIICPEHGEFWQKASHHLNGVGCPLCVGKGMKQYKFNLLQEFESEYELRAFLENNDVNIIYVILRNIEPKFEPIKGDIEKALKNVELKDPIQALEEKYTKGDEEETEETSTDKKEEETTTIDITNVDLDDENAVNDVIGNEDAEEEEDTNTEPTIEDIVKNTEKELEVISKIEHMLTPEDREYIMEKFLNDKLRDWMANREASKND